jgi:hypothetical protein
VNSGLEDTMDWVSQINIYFFLYIKIKITSNYIIMDKIPSASDLRTKVNKFIEVQNKEKYKYIKNNINSAAKKGSSFVYLGLSRSGDLVTGYNITEYVEELRSLGYTVTGKEEQDFSGYKVEW